MNMSFALIESNKMKSLYAAASLYWEFKIKYTLYFFNSCNNVCAPYVHYINTTLDQATLLFLKVKVNEIAQHRKNSDAFMFYLKNKFVSLFFFSYPI